MFKSTTKQTLSALVDMSLSAEALADLEGGRSPRDPASRRALPPFLATTLVVGEEADAPRPPVTTLAVGEESGGIRPPVTTLAVGEESGGIRPPMTTLVVGEEG